MKGLSTETTLDIRKECAVCWNAEAYLSVCIQSVTGILLGEIIVRIEVTWKHASKCIVLVDQQTLQLIDHHGSLLFVNMYLVAQIRLDRGLGDLW